MLDRLEILKWKILDWFYDTKWYFRNLKVFKKAIREFRPWDHAHCVNIYLCSLKLLREQIDKKGREEIVSKTKKLEAIDELIDMLAYYGHLDEYKPYKSYFDQNNDIDEATYLAEFNYFTRIGRILRGQSKTEEREKLQELRAKLKDPLFKKEFLVKYKLEDVSDSKYDYFVQHDVFDGTGCLNWWE